MAAKPKKPSAKKPAAKAKAKPAAKRPAPKRGDANEIYNAGLELAKSIEPALRAGKLSEGQRQILEASEAKFREALELAENHGRAHIMLATLLRYTGRQEEAIPHFRRAMTLPPDTPDWVAACEGLASCLMNPATVAEAIEVLNTGLKQYPDNALFNYKLGACLLETGRRDEAVRRLERAVQSDPSHQGARQMLEQARAAAPAPAPTPAPQGDWAAKQVETQKLALELQTAIQKLMTGPGDAGEKTRRAIELQQEFQRKVQKLYGM